MRRLFPVTDQTVTTDSGGRPPGAPGDGGGAAADHEWSLDELADAYGYPEPGPGEPRPWLRANMVSTLDGAAQHDGRSQPISTATDMRIFGTLRGLADVVVVGAETVRLEAQVRDGGGAYGRWGDGGRGGGGGGGGPAGEG
ncbi:dihydrofolate reductase family protein, partial [Streptomyces sp. NPDC005486]|uniref:dihydrofolate reductase family protein n=1 Tax=Streptomyces sp. NPDC005486 TaxID=3155345 RepID=UPI0033B00097